MPQEPLSAVVDYLRKVCARQELHNQADGDLLKKFAATRDEGAFAVLVHRHGPMVLGVCKRVLGNFHDAEDAFQAAFMVLSRQLDQAAQELGCAKSSLASRLERARELLRQRLVKRGIVLSTGALVTALTEKTAAAAVGAMLTITTAKAAATFAANKVVPASLLSPHALALAEEMLMGRIGIKAKLLALVLALGLVVGGAGVAGYYVLGGRAPSDVPPAARNPEPTLVPKNDPGGQQGKDVLPAVSVDQTIRVLEFPSGKEIRRITLATLDLSGLQGFGVRAAMTKNGKTIATWRPASLRQLDDSVKARETATVELLKYGEQLVPAVDAALAANPPLER